MENNCIQTLKTVLDKQPDLEPVAAATLQVLNRVADDTGGDLAAEMSVAFPSQH